MKLESAQIRAKSLLADSPDAFFQAHAEAVYAYAIRRVSNRSAAEDITAEVFLEAVRHSKKRSHTEPLPWLYGIARRKLADYFRSHRRRKFEPLTETIPALGGDPHRAAEFSERSDELRRLVASLPSDQREALLLYYLEGLPAELVAVSLGKSIAATNSLLQRARQSLRERSFQSEIIP